MSLILEALKKSEQQRRLGEAPTLASPVVATRRRRSLLPILAILVIAAAAAGWWLMRPHAPAPAAPSTSVAAQATNPTTAPNAAARAPAPVADNRAKLASEAARRNALRTEQEKRVAGVGNNAHTPAPTAAPATAKGMSVTAPTAAVPTTPLPPLVQKPSDVDAGASRAPATTDHAVVSAPPAGGKTDPAAPATKTDKAADSVPSIWDLPFATRKDLPAIDLSMHVYSADPKQRFVVIKGDRHVEGDEVGSDLILREIRQDGLVLDYKGQRFFFPRSGR
jgi:general secretion pathway protein B